MEEFNVMKGFNVSRLSFISLLPIVIAVLLFPIVWYTIATEWYLAEQDNTHAFPAFIAALYIAITSQYRIQTAAKSLYWLYSLCLVSILVAYLLVQTINIEILTFASMISGLIILFIMFFGVHNWLKSILIIFLIGMALPIWDVLLEPLVVVASTIVTKLVNQFNIAVLIEGNSITTPYGRILIAEGCSGIRYLMVSIILAAIVSHTNHYKPPHTILTIGLGILIGLAANWTRITLLILIGYYSEMQSSLMHDHEIFGWVVFACFIMPAMYFAPHKKTENKTYPHVTPIKLKPILPVIFLLFLIVNGTLLAVSNSFQGVKTSIEKHPSAWLPTSLPAELSQFPIQKNEPMTWYQPENMTIYAGVMSNSKNKISEKLVPYLQQSLVNEKWFLERDIPFNTNGTSFSMQIIKSLTDNQRYVRTQLFNTGSDWSSSYSTAKIQQITAVLLGKNNFSYFLILAECKSMTCKQAIDETINLAELVITQ